MDCPLCSHSSNIFYSQETHYVYECTHCHLIYKDHQAFLSQDEEEKRYQFHINDISDAGYVDFLNRLLIPLKKFIPINFRALDYGCGPGPTLEILLKDCGGEAFSFDPLFFPDAQLLIPDFYNVVTCTEVVEHFKKPADDWKRLIDLVSTGGYLGVMTQFYSPNVNYNDWWYKNDPTHVVFYQQETLNFLAQKHQLKVIYNDSRSVVIFQKIGE